MRSSRSEPMWSQWEAFLGSIFCALQIPLPLEPILRCGMENGDAGAEPCQPWLIHDIHGAFWEQGKGWGSAQASPMPVVLPGLEQAPGEGQDSSRLSHSHQEHSCSLSPTYSWPRSPLPCRGLWRAACCAKHSLSSVSPGTETFLIVDSFS